MPYKGLLVWEGKSTTTYRPIGADIVEQSLKIAWQKAYAEALRECGASLGGYPPLPPPAAGGRKYFGWVRGTHPEDGKGVLVAIFLHAEESEPLRGLERVFYTAKALGAEGLETETPRYPIPPEEDEGWCREDNAAEMIYRAHYDLWPPGYGPS